MTDLFVAKCLNFMFFIYVSHYSPVKLWEKPFNRFNNVKYHSVVEPVESLFHQISFILTCA